MLYIEYIPSLISLHFPFWHSSVWVISNPGLINPGSISGRLGHGAPPFCWVWTTTHFLVLDPSPQVTEQSLQPPTSTLQSCLHRLLSHSSVWKRLAGQAAPPCSGLRTISNSLLLVHFFPLRVREQSLNLFVLVLQCTGKRS